jgi:hypothetical protein
VLQRLLGQRLLVVAEQPSMSSMRDRIHSRKSVATWSLRERAVCSRRPRPDQLGSRLSTFIWMSSSAA